MRVLYLFSGTRKDKYAGTPGIDFPDTQLYGLNHLAQLNIQAEFKEFGDVVKSPFLQRIAGFRLRHLFLFFSTRTYDIVFGSSLLYMMALKNLFGSRAKYLLLNISLARTLRINEKRYLRHRLIERLLRELSCIVCLSHSQQRWLEKKYPLLAPKLRTVPLGVDTTFYKPVYEKRSETILSVGRDNGRDYQTLIEAARQMPDRRFEIVCSPRNIIGIGDIPANVTVMYNLPLEKVIEKYYSSALTIISTHDDSFGDGSDCSGQTVLLEAMATGLPVIATKKEYIAEYVTDGTEALLVPAYDPQAIVEAVMRLQDVSARLQIARRARDRAERDFSTEKMAENLARCFREYAAT